ncbi:MAG TPA: hypothetical protein VFH83_15245, partial [Spirochaetia bacterium]|nr:hypothetical protein [Spirochaetia bacterium]
APSQDVHRAAPVNVPVLPVSDVQVKPTPNAVSDAEVSEAQAALRDASAWGAEYYEPQMYAKAQATLKAALAARYHDPAQCRSLLSGAAEAASSAKGAALAAYQDDVKSRFEASRAKLVEIGADRAFPDEYASLQSGMDATIGLFANGSYWDARVKAYGTLKGMSDLYERVHGLSIWLRDARIRVGNAISDARALDAPRWAPADMQDAEQKYHDALTRMQAGDLTAAVDSMRAAGQIAARLPLLKDRIDKPGAGTPPVAGGSVPPAAGAPPATQKPRGQGPDQRLQQESAEKSLSGQRVRIADMSMSSLGAAQRLYSDFSAAVARFDVVAAEGLRDAGIMEKVLAGLNDRWEAAVSRSGYFGFIFGDRVEMVRDLGTYPGERGLLRSPYAAQFRLLGTRFLVNLVLCHVEASKDNQATAAAVAQLADIYRYFENLTGNRGVTLLLVGGLGDLPEPTSSDSLMPQGEVVSLRTNVTATAGAHNQGQRMFASAALQPLVAESGSSASTPPFAYVTLGKGE